MKFALVAALFAICLYVCSAYSFQQKDDDTINYALDGMFFPQNFVKRIESNQFYKNEILLRSPEDMWQQLVKEISEHHSKIRENKEFKQLSADDLQNYSVICKQRLQALYIEHLSLTHNSGQLVYALTVSLIPMLVYYSSKISRVTGQAVLLIGAFFFWLVVYYAWSNRRKHMIANHLERLYELSIFFLTQEIQERSISGKRIIA